MLSGQDLPQYSTLFTSISTYIKALLGEYDYESVSRLEPVWGSIIGFVYMLASLFVLVTVIVAILSTAFDETRAQLGLKKKTAAKQHLSDT